MKSPLARHEPMCFSDINHQPTLFSDSTDELSRNLYLQYHTGLSLAEGHISSLNV